MNNANPTIKVINALDPNADPDPYVLVLDDDDEPYNVEDLVKIKATDAYGKDISDQIVYDSHSVDWTKPGDYPVEVSVMDDNLNMTTTFFVVHMVTQKEAKSIESGRNKPKSGSRKAAREAKELKKDVLVDKIFVGFITVVFVAFLIYTYVDAFQGDKMAALITTFAFLIIFCFLVPIFAKELLHPYEELEQYRGKSLWYQFTHLLYKDVLKFIVIGIPVMLILTVWLNFVTLKFGTKVFISTLAAIILGVGFIVIVKTNRK